MAAVSMGVFLATLDGSIVNIAVPTLETALNTQFAVVQWVVLAYLLTVTVLLLGVGRLADIIGKKSIYTVGFIVFTAGSVLCALAPTVGWLIGFRVFQAVGAAMVMALGPAIITEAFPSWQRGQALGIIGTAVSAGIVAGPVVGGFLLDQYSWHWIFLVNLPFGIIGTLMVLKFVPAIPPAGGQRFDYAGAAMLFVSLMSLLLALTFGQRIGFDNQIILVLFLGWLLTLAAFLAIEWRSEQPMIDLRLFANTDFSIGLMVGYITFVLIAGILFLMPFYLENVLDYSPRVAGQLLGVLPLSLGIMAPLSGWLSDRVGTRLIALIGLFVLVVSYWNITRLSVQTTTLGFALALLPLGIGMGVFQSPNNSAIMGTVPPHQLGIASGLLAITRTLGQTTGIAVLNALWASRIAVYAPAVPRDELTSAPDAAQVAALHDVGVVAVVMISLALGLGVVGWVRQRRHVEHSATT